VLIAASSGYHSGCDGRIRCPVAPAPALAASQRPRCRALRGRYVLAVDLVGEVLYEHQKREMEATLGALLLNIARTGAYLIDPAQHLVVQQTLTQETNAYLRVRHALSIVQDENRIATPVYTRARRLRGFV